MEIATKIFEAGLKKHAAVPSFVQAFITLLQHTNDEGNLRLLFERIVGTGASAGAIAGAAAADATGTPQGPEDTDSYDDVWQREAWNRFVQVGAVPVSMKCTNVGTF